MKFTVIRYVGYAYDRGKVFFTGCNDVAGVALSTLLSGGKTAANVSVKLVDKAKDVPGHLVTHMVIRDE